MRHLPDQVVYRDLELLAGLLGFSWRLGGATLIGEKQPTNYARPKNVTRHGSVGGMTL